MSMSKRSNLVWLVAIAAVVSIAVGGVITAQGPDRIRASFDAAPPDQLTKRLPAVVKGDMAVTTDAVKGLSVLSFDDGSCESGLGAGALVTAIVDFDVPTQCIQGGLDIVGITARMNSGSAQNFAFGQAGAAPPAAGTLSTAAMTNIGPLGPCPATALTSRSIGPSAAVITGTSNFFAGMVNTGFAGRDSNGPPAGRIWLNCATCGMTQYSPTDISGLGLGGNWMIRVTVEDANCIPVELMEFTVD